MKQSASTIIIKKYANRRLYNTDSSSYVTLEELASMVRDNIDFMVCDVKTGEDITRSVLTQIILEAECHGQHNLLPISFLRQIISFYGDQMKHATFPHFLEMSMHNFMENQAQFHKLAQDNLSNMFSMPDMKDIGRNNMAMMQNAMQIFNPLLPAGGQENIGERRGSGEKRDNGDKKHNAQDELSQLKAQLDAMQSQLNRLQSS